jgi:hypothetical protein
MGNDSAKDVPKVIAGGNYPITGAPHPINKPLRLCTCESIPPLQSRCDSQRHLLWCNPTFGWFKVGVPCIATSLRCNPTFEWHNDGQSEVRITTATSRCSRTSCNTSIRGAPTPNPRANRRTPHGGRNGQAEATEQAAATRATRATGAHNTVVYPHGSGLPPPQTGTPTRVSQRNVPSWHCHVASGR